MQHFADLFTALDQTTSTKAKVAALAQYFTVAPAPDRLWTIALLSGRRPRRAVTTTRLREWAAETAEVPLWLVEESYAVVGDLAETLALVLPPAKTTRDQSLADWMAALKALAGEEEPARKSFIVDAWASLGATERFVFNKLITGGFRIGVSRKLMTRGLSQATGIDEPRLAHRLMGDWTPESTSFEDLILSDDPDDDLSRPYPFYLAYQLDDAPDALGDASDWLAEYKWDGIRGQLIRRGGAHHLWSRGEELMTDRFPELSASRDFVPDGTVLDGEVLAWDREADRPLPFNALQKRIGRKTVPKKLLTQAPVILLAYDLLEWEGKNLRDAPLEQRRAMLERLASDIPGAAHLKISPKIDFEDWDALAVLRDQARDKGAEGVMLKNKAAPYRAGRIKGDWWKWKVDPLMIDAVMIYAQAGSGRRANLFTDFTFAVRDGEDLVPFTKAYSGLTDAEFREITAWVRRNTLERFGPVRRVTPTHVFEIAFEGIQESPRHKSGVALRFPRMSRWRRDKPVGEANTLHDLHEMLRVYG